MAPLPQIQRWLMGPYGGPMLISMHLHIFDVIIFYIPDSSECVRSMLAERRKTYISSHCIYWHRRWIEWRSDCLWSIALDAVLCRVSVPSSLLCFFSIWLSGRQDQAQVWNARILTGAQWFWHVVEKIESKDLRQITISVIWRRVAVLYIRNCLAMQHVESQLSLRINGSNMILLVHTCSYNYTVYR